MRRYHVKWKDHIDNEAFVHIRNGLRSDGTAQGRQIPLTAKKMSLFGSTLYIEKLPIRCAVRLIEASLLYIRLLEEIV